ncbi:malonic semialdehyde reductase [Oecophyllibacter saccharovorans]|nr:malonic semialdehyde reductase [Oecophyllibacter saccharovorans]
MYSSTVSPAPDAPDPVLTELFTHHRTPAGFSDRPVEGWMLRRLYDLAKLGPTSGNCSPARVVFLTTEEAKEKLRPALAAGNVARAMQAPVIAAIGYDSLFFEQLPRLSPVEGLRDWFAADVGLSEETAFRNGSLQGAYFLMAARTLGLAALPMSGFDALSVEENIFPNRSWRANFLLALGYPQEGTPLPPRAPRLSFDEACLCL